MIQDQKAPRILWGIEGGHADHGSTSETQHIMIEIDGSFGEGGGQILRTALGLSCLFGKPFTMANIRKARKKPGLMPQHLTGVRAAQLLSHAEVKGEEMGSMELVFSPREVSGGSFVFDVGTAGSTLLLLQTLIPALLSTKERSDLILKGGTHVPCAPSFHYVKEIFVPFVERIGIRMTLAIDSCGFYPRGGGKIRAEVFPSRVTKPLVINERGKITSLKGCSGVANLPFTVAERQRRALIEKVHADNRDLRCVESIDMISTAAAGRGSYVFLSAVSEHSLAGFTSLGERGKKAETVGKETAAEFSDYYATGSALDPHLPDQLVIYLALCEKESSFTTSRITHHLLTNLMTIGLFHEFRYSVEGELGKPGKIRINQSA